MWTIGDNLYGVIVNFDPYQGADLCLCIPPRFMEFHGMPVGWGSNDWVTREVVAFYKQLTARFLKVHEVVELEYVLIQEEGWTYSLPPGAEGIYMAQEIAKFIEGAGDTYHTLACIGFS